MSRIVDVIMIYDAELEIAKNQLAVDKNIGRMEHILT
jgi:hypothetical protein